MVVLAEDVAQGEPPAVALGVLGSPTDHAATAIRAISRSAQEQAKEEPVFNYSSSPVPAASPDLMKMAG